MISCCLLADFCVILIVINQSTSTQIPALSHKRGETTYMDCLKNLMSAAASKSSSVGGKSRNFV